jgi:hypothetical protein
MNPFTRFLNQWSKNRKLDEFIAYWDALETIVIHVYRQKVSLDEAGPEFERVWAWLRARYGAWEGVLRPYWQQTKAAGEPTQTDPFRLLLDIQNPAAILGDWRAMQHLPAAREALNLYLQDANNKF